MYDFIYYYFYRLAIKRNPDAKFNAAALVYFTLFMHVLLILTIIKKLFDVSLSVEFSDSYLINKVCMMPFGIALLAMVHYVFKRRFWKIERKYEGRKMTTFWNTIIVFSIMLVPLVAIIMLLQ